MSLDIQALEEELKTIEAERFTVLFFTNLLLRRCLLEANTQGAIGVLATILLLLTLSFPLLVIDTSLSVFVSTDSARS